MTTHVLIDGTSFHFYRVCATRSWYQKSQQTDDFTSHLLRHYEQSLHKLEKATGLSANQMYFIRDCPRQDIWRRQFFPSYKAHRDDRSAKSWQPGPYIKLLNEQCTRRYKAVLRIHQAEADDIIALLAHLMGAEDTCYIITLDSDLQQLHRHRRHYPQIRIISPKTWRPHFYLSHSKATEALEQKIWKGDPTDNVPAAHDDKSFLRNCQLIDLDYVPRYILHRLIAELKHLEDWSQLNEYHYRQAIQLGLCCLNTKLRQQGIFCSRSLILRTIQQKGLGELKKRALENCKDLLTMVHWNAKNNIRVLRISSDIFPHLGNPRAPSYTLDFALPLLREVGYWARRYKQRLTFHPGQYNVVGTPREDVFNNTVLELDWHAQVLDLMGTDQDSVMVVHGGGIYGDKEATMQRWVANFQRLPARVQRRLVLENCEKCYSVKDCLWISGQVNIPVVLDTHHDECYRLLHPDEKLDAIDTYLDDILAVWQKRGIKPKFHISQQAEGGKIGKHSDFIETIPKWLIEWVHRRDIELDLMVEAKMKEQAIFQLSRNSLHQ